MKNIITYLNCGRYHLSVDRVEYLCLKLYDIIENIIFLFVKKPNLGVKSEDFKDRCKAALIMQYKGHKIALDFIEL